MQIFFTFSLFMQYGYQFKKFLVLIIKECYFKVIRIYYAAGSMISQKLSFWGTFSVLLFQSFCYLCFIIFKNGMKLKTNLIIKKKDSIRNRRIW